MDAQEFLEFFFHFQYDQHACFKLYPLFSLLLLQTFHLSFF